MTPYNPSITKEANNGFSLPFADDKYDTALVQNVEQTLTVPGEQGTGASYSSTNRYIALFKIEDGTTVWVANNATATNAGAAFATTDSEMIKSGEARFVKAGDVLHFITPDTGGSIVSVSFYSIT